MIRDANLVVSHTDFTNAHASSELYLTSDKGPLESFTERGGLGGNQGLCLRLWLS